MSLVHNGCILFQTLKITRHEDADNLSDLVILQGWNCYCFCLTVAVTACHIYIIECKICLVIHSEWPCVPDVLCLLTLPSQRVRRILVKGVNAPLPPKAKKVLKIWLRMVHSEVNLNKYVVSIAPFSTPACPDCSQNIQKTALFCMLSLFNFSSISRGGQLTPFAPTCGCPVHIPFQCPSMGPQQQTHCCRFGAQLAFGNSDSRMRAVSRCQWT